MQDVGQVNGIGLISLRALSPSLPLSHSLALVGFRETKDGTRPILVHLKFVDMVAGVADLAHLDRWVHFAIGRITDRSINLCVRACACIYTHNQAYDHACKHTHIRASVHRGHTNTHTNGRTDAYTQVHAHIRRHKHIPPASAPEGSDAN